MASVPLKPFGQIQGILILLHGRHGRKEILLPVAERFAAIGFNCVIPDLPAHGESPDDQVFFSTTHFEQGIVENMLVDARTFFNDLKSPASIWGLSMGGAYAIESASRSPYLWQALIVVSSFDSLDGMVEVKLNFLPRIISNSAKQIFTAMVKYRSGLVLQYVQPAIWATKVTTPVLIAHGEIDPLISIERGKRLFNALQSAKKLWVSVPQAKHNNILVTDMPLYSKMGAWLISNNTK